MIGFTAGDCVSGTVDIHLPQRKLFSELTVEFVGVERIFIPLAKN